MSELEAYIGPAPDEKGLADYYLKSEVDKVISEKDAEIAELKAQKAQAEDDCAYWKMNHGNATNAMHETEEYAMQLYKELRHQKFMRCNLLIDYCGLKQNTCEEEKVPFWRKWYFRWCELSDKFKEED